jgi:cellulose synthase operon protein C
MRFMSEEGYSPRSLTTSIQAIPTSENVVALPRDEEVKARIAYLEKEARSLGNSPHAALLFHEAGLLWESLKQARSAAVAYQSAFKLAPGFLANIRAARRLFSDVGNWTMVVQLLEAEFSAAESKRMQAALLFEQGQVLETRLSKEAEATAAFEKCLDYGPEDVTLLVQLEQAFTDRADYPRLVKVERLLGEKLKDVGARVEYLTSAAQLLEDRLANPTEAAVLYRQAFSLERKNPQLLAAIKRLAQREGNPEEELAALAAEAELLGDRAAPTYLQIARTYERLHRPHDALSALVAARRANSDDALVLSELARVYEGDNRREELADVLKAWAAKNRDESEFVSLQLRLAQINEELGRHDEAVASFREIEARVKGHPMALAGLGKLYARTQNWNGLLETYEKEALAADESQHKATRLYKAAETLEERLGRVEEAIVRYRDCLSASPGFLPAQKALVRIFESRSMWAELVGIYEQDLLQTGDKESQISALNKMVGILEDRLSEFDRAIELVKRVLELSADNAAAFRNLSRLYERTGRFADLIELNDRRAAISADTKEVISLAHRNAELTQEHLKDRTQAIVAWERVLQLSPSYLPALRALGGLYAQESRWDSMVKMYRTESEIETSPEKASQVVHKIGELYEHRIQDTDKAVIAYREALDLDPTSSNTLRALGRLFRGRSEWESLIEILRAEAASLTEPTERANALFQAGSLWEEKLGRPESAIEAYQEALRLAPGHPTATQQLERLLLVKDDIKEVVVLFDRQMQLGQDKLKASAGMKLARIYFDKFNEPVRAAACCEAVLEVEPHNLGALRLLNRIRSRDRSRRHETRLKLGQALGDPKLLAAFRLMASESETTQDTLSLLRASHTDDPSDETLTMSLERLLKKTGDMAGLVALMEQRLSETHDPSTALHMKLRLAELFEGQVKDTPKALTLYQAAIESSAPLLPAHMGKIRCLTALGRSDDVVLAMELMATHVSDVSLKTQTLVEAAALSLSRHPTGEKATALYRVVLNFDPLHAEATAGLEALLVKRGDSNDLGLLHARRAEVRQSQGDLAAAGREYFLAAQRMLEVPNERQRATELLDRALMANPNQMEALELKGNLALEEQNYLEAAAAFGARVKQGGDATTLSALHLKLGALYHDHLSDSSKAVTHLQSALSAAPKTVEALERLAAIHLNSRNWTSAADCTRQVLESILPLPDRARHTLLLAKILDEGFGDTEAAIAQFRKALELMPGDQQVLDRLVILYEKMGSLEGLVQVLMQQANQASDVKKASALKLRVAELQLKSLGDSTKAIGTYRQVLELEPNSLGAYVALADLYSKDTSSLAMSIDAHRNILRIDASKLQSLHALFRIWESQRQFDRAFCASAVLTFFQSATDLEMSFYQDARTRVPSEFRGSPLTPNEVQSMAAPHARHPALSVIRAVGDQLSKMLPPGFEALGVDRKTDKLKADHALVKAVASVTRMFGVEEFECFQSKRGLVVVEPAEPLAMCLGPDVVRRFNLREQRFLFGRASFALATKSAMVRKMATAELLDLIGNSVRIHQPSFVGSKRLSDEQSKLLRRAYSRKALKALEEPALQMLSAMPLQIDSFASDVELSSDRAGLVAAGDPAAALSMLLKEDVRAHSAKAEGIDGITKAVQERPEMKQAVTYCLSDEFFRLRQRIGTSL